MSSNALIPTNQGDTNKINLRSLVNLTAYKVFKTDVSSIAANEKQIIINELNEAQRQLAIKSDTWQWLNKTKTLNSYNFESVPTSGVNFAQVSINSPYGAISGSPNTYYYSAQPFVYGVDTSKLSSITIQVNNAATTYFPPTGSLKVYICSDDGSNIGNGTSPNFNTKLLTSDSQTVAGILGTVNSALATFPLLGVDFEPKVGTQYWVVVEGHNINAVNGMPITGLGYYSTGMSLPDIIPHHLKNSNDGISWQGSGSVGQSLWFSFEMRTRFYMYELIGPSDCATPQRLYSPISHANPSTYVLRMMPYDYVQNSVFANYRLGTEFFTVMGYTPLGQPKFMIPISLKVGGWQLDYKAKVTTMVDDDDMPMCPSEYSTILVLMATVSLISLGYGTQDTPYLVLLDKQIQGLMQGMMRDYNNRGEQYMNIIGSTYYPGQSSRVKQLNEKYSGPQRLGVFPPSN